MFCVVIYSLSMTFLYLNYYNFFPFSFGFPFQQTPLSAICDGCCYCYQFPAFSLSLHMCLFFVFESYYYYFFFLAASFFFFDVSLLSSPTVQRTQEKEVKGKRGKKQHRNVKKNKGTKRKIFTLCIFFFNFFLVHRYTYGYPYIPIYIYLSIYLYLFFFLILLNR